MEPARTRAHDMVPADIGRMGVLRVLTIGSEGGFAGAAIGGASAADARRTRAEPAA